LVIAAMFALALVLVGACAVPVAVAARIGVPHGIYEHRGDVSLVVVAATVAVALVLFVTSIMSGSG
jgi:predicted membrane-bound mannosyltransferase